MNVSKPFSKTSISPNFGLPFDIGEVPKVLEVVGLAIVVVGSCWLVTGGQCELMMELLCSPIEPVLEVVVLVKCSTLDNVKVARAKDFVVLHVIPGGCNMVKGVLLTFLLPELVDNLAVFCFAPLERAGRLVHMSSEERDCLPARLLRGKSQSQTPPPPRILKYGNYCQPPAPRSYLDPASPSSPTLNSASPSPTRPPRRIVSRVRHLSTAAASLTTGFCLLLNSTRAVHKPPSFFDCWPAPAPPLEQPSSLPTSETPSQHHKNPSLGSFHQRAQRSDQCWNFHGKFPHWPQLEHFLMGSGFLPHSGFLQWGRMLLPEDSLAGLL